MSLPASFKKGLVTKSDEISIQKYLFRGIIGRVHPQNQFVMNWMQWVDGNCSSLQLQSKISSSPAWFEGVEGGFAKAGRRGPHGGKS